MIHMRPYNDFEIENIKFLVDNQIDFTNLQITETGLKKSIMDATEPVREYFRKEGIHNYDHQEQGPDHKKLIDTYILDSTARHLTKTSLYRPVTKKGDPRLWVNKVKDVDFLRANDIFIFIAYEKILYAINISQVNIPKVCNSTIATPLKEILNSAT